MKQVWNLVFALDCLVGVWCVEDSAYQRGYVDGDREAKAFQNRIDAQLRQASFCEWPKVFYSKVNCGTLAPDHP